MAATDWRARPLGTAILFFIVGVLFASAMDWTPFGHAQSSTASAPPASAVRSLTESSNAFVAIAEHVTPAVVAIQTQRTTQASAMPPQFRGIIPQPREPLEGSGSGFIISSDGHIITNNHVVADADRITVVMSDRKQYAATIVGRDPHTDVAVLKIDAKNLPTIDIGDDEKLRIGEWVLAVGNPLGLDFTVTAGIVSAKGRSRAEVPVNTSAWGITDFIQTDAAINPGNSGGPLVNIRGEVVGINTAIASRTGTYTGYGFAIPVGLARVVWQDLVENGRVRRAALGVNIEEVSVEDAQVAGITEIRGAKVVSCTPDSIAPSAACRAGVEPNDVILTADGREVDRVSTLQRLVRAKKPGESIALRVMRYGKERQFNVKLIEANTAERAVAVADTRQPARDQNPGERLGIEVAPLSDAFLRQVDVPREYRGLQVVDVDVSTAARRLFQPDRDILVSVLPAGTPLRTADDLRRVLSAKRAGDVVSLSVYDAGTGQTRAVNVRVQQ